MTLVERMRRARESWVAAGKWEFLLRRPTAWQVALWTRDGGGRASATERFVLGECVVDWRGVAELDLVPGGDGAAVPFDREAFVEWIQDRPVEHAALMKELRRLIDVHAEAGETDAKN